MFKIHTIAGSRQADTEYLPSSAIKTEAGMLLHMSGGVLVQTSNTDVPTYLCLHTSDGVLEKGTCIPVTRISSDVVIEGIRRDGMSHEEVLIGQKISLSPDGKEFVSVEGAAEVVYVDESVIRVRFI